MDIHVHVSMMGVCYGNIPGWTSCTIDLKLAAAKRRYAGYMEVRSLQPTTACAADTSAMHVSGGPVPCPDREPGCNFLCSASSTFFLPMMFRTGNKQHTSHKAVSRCHNLH